MGVPRDKAGRCERVKQMMRHKCVVRACYEAYAGEEDVSYTEVYLDEDANRKDIGCSNAGLRQ